MTIPARHKVERKPRGQRFGFGRFMSEEPNTITWRLFRRDARNRVHVFAYQVDAEAPREYIAARIWNARIRLRDQVDEIDLVLLGLVEEVT